MPPNNSWRRKNPLALLAVLLLALLTPRLAGQELAQTARATATPSPALPVAPPAESGHDEVIPPRPDHYFNDYAGVIPAAAARELERKLEQFERATSNQIVVAMFPVMKTRSSIEDYTVRIAEAWKVGQKGRDNGAILFIFLKERKVYIQVGYGLEGVLTDFLSRQIIENEIKPPFQRGDYALGVRNGVDAMIQATKGEYKGSGRTAADRARRNKGEGSGLGNFLFLLFIFYIIYLARKKGGGGGSNTRGGGMPPIFWGGGGGGGRGGGGGFRGGGGRFGGGGAGGGW